MFRELGVKSWFIVTAEFANKKSTPYSFPCSRKGVLLWQ